MKQALNFSWQYRPDFKDDYLSLFPDESQNVDIPHSNISIPMHYFDEQCYQFISTYQKRFDVETEIGDQKVYLHFAGFMVKAKIYLNGVYLGEHVSTYLPVKLDITGVVKQLDNRLVVVLDAKEDPEIPPFGHVIDYLTYGGIYREVYLEIDAIQHLKHLHVHGDHHGLLTIDYAVENADLAPYRVSFELTYLGQIVATFTTPKFTLDSVKPWSIEHPHLYELRAMLSSDLVETSSLVRFGFRTAVFKTDGFYLNDQKVKLIGLNRHQAYAHVGYAMPKSMQKDDVLILKHTLGVNVVRTSHYPQSEHFLNACDELGLCVIQEVPGWQHIGASQTWKAHVLDFVKRMILATYHHPSIILHGVRINESQDDHDLYVKTNALAHRLDPYRQTGGVRNFKKSELLEDVYTYNDFLHHGGNPGLENPKKVLPKDAPYLVTECNGHMYPTKAFDAERIRVEHAHRHLKVMDSAFQYERISGVIGWCMNDYHTHRDFGSGDHICYHGVLDMFRNPKMAAASYASQRDDQPVFEVLSSMNIGEHPEGLLGTVTVLSNVEMVKLYKNEQYIATFYPDTKKYPHLKHAPFTIDEYIGDAIYQEQGLPKKALKKLKKALNEATIKGLSHVSPKTMLMIGYLMLRYRLSYARLVALWEKYVSNWGQKTLIYRFDGIQNGTVVATKTIAPLLSLSLVADCHQLKFEIADTYDVQKVILRYLDEHQNIAHLSAMPLQLSIEGPFTILGPSLQSLHGGQLTVYVKTTNQTGGQGTLSITTDEGKVLHIELISQRR